LQSADLATLASRGALDAVRHVELENLLVSLYDQQGKCERIKNFPYPRQFATLNLYFVHLFTLLVPFGMLQEFDKLGDHFVWLTIPFSTMVCWVFLTMEKIGEATENPFEGTANDIPMAALSRTIEIDLRDMLDEKELPVPVQPVNDILM
jgi:putative membrane protein